MCLPENHVTLWDMEDIADIVRHRSVQSNVKREMLGAGRNLDEKIASLVLVRGSFAPSQDF